jgi:5-methyltetrahydropteroyltriglutamate--homocysteine methyltransferase
LSDHVSLECASSNVPMSVLGLLPDKEILVGAIDVATTTVETPEQVADTLRRAAEFVDPERIIACTNCGGPLPRDVSEAKLRALGAGARLFREKLGS